MLSAFIAALTIAASAGGLFLADHYRDNAFAASAWRGTDLATLTIAVPILVVALMLARRSSLRAQLVWLGMLDYTLYNFAFYLFGAAFNRFFLIYAALFTLSIFALIFGLSKMNVQEVAQRFASKTPVRWISGYMLFVAAGIGGLWIAQSLGFVFTGQVPQFIVDVGHPTSVVFALDLSLVVPFLVLGAIWLWQRRPWGYLLAAISCVKGTVYMLALAVASVFQAQVGFRAGLTQLPLWGALSSGFLAASLFLLSNVKSTNQSDDAVLS
jgi:hypothetical protein